MSPLPRDGKKYLLNCRSFRSPITLLKQVNTRATIGLQGENTCNHPLDISTYSNNGI
jgi:hypothetical protein